MAPLNQNPRHKHPRSAGSGDPGSGGPDSGGRGSGGRGPNELPGRAGIAPPWPAEEPAWYLHRPRLDVLLDRLGEADARVLVLWDAPGAGKSALMGGWARQLTAAGEKVAWFTGADLSSAGAVQTDALETGAVQTGAVQTGAVQPGGTRVRYVFVDDLEDVPPPAGGWDLARLPERFAGAATEVRFVVACRQRLGARTAPSEAAGVVIECADDTLAFTRAETFALAHRLGVEITARDGDALWQHTGGWPTGLALALTLRQEGDTVDLGTFGGDDPAVADFLAAEVIADLDDADLDVLRLAAVGQDVPLDLAVAITGRSNAGEVLERVAHRCAMISRVSDASGDEHYRYHPVLLAYLEAEGRRRDAPGWTARHVAACRWFAHRAEGGRAVEQALAARRPQLIIDMLERFGLELALTGSTELIDRALIKLDGALTSTATFSLRLLLEAPHFTGRRRVQQLLAAADQAVLAQEREAAARAGFGTPRGPSRALPLVPRAASAEAQTTPAAVRTTDWAAVVQTLHAFQATERADIERGLQLLRTRATTSSPARADLALDLLAATAEGRCLAEIGRPDLAEESLSEVVESARAAGYHWLFLVASDLAATAAARNGNWLHVARLENEMAAAAAQVTRAADHATGRAVLYSMILRYEHCQAIDTEVLTELASTESTASDAGVSVPAQVLLLLVQLDHSPYSRSALDRLMLLMREHAAVHPRSLSLCCMALTETSGVLDGRAETHVVVRLVEQVLGSDSLEALLLRFLLVPPTRAGHPAEERLRDAALEESSAWRGTTIVSAWIALANVAEVSGRHVESDARLLRALRLASRFGCERAFLAVGGQGIGLITSRLGRLGDLDEFARHIVNRAAEMRMGLAVPSPDRARSSPLLTQREREVLRELPIHQSVADIARKRNVSPNTVKTHLRNIYQKLEANNRAEAVAIAQDRGLL